MEWVNAKYNNPPYSRDPKPYLVILQSNATNLHSKTWAGKGKPEIAYWCNEYEGYKWNSRGDLSVAYWMPLPKFHGKWVDGLDGEEGHWEFPKIQV